MRGKLYPCPEVGLDSKSVNQILFLNFDVESTHYRLSVEEIVSRGLSLKVSGGSQTEC